MLRRSLRLPRPDNRACVWGSIGPQTSSTTAAGRPECKSGPRDSRSSYHPPAVAQSVLEQVWVVLVTDLEARRRFQRMLRKHRYLDGLKAVGEQLYYAAVDAWHARRLAISLFMHWRARQPRPLPQFLTDFQSAMGESNLTKALAFVTQQHPKRLWPLHTYALF